MNKSSPIVLRRITPTRSASAPAVTYPSLPVIPIKCQKHNGHLVATLGGTHKVVRPVCLECKMHGPVFCCCFQCPMCQSKPPKDIMDDVLEMHNRLIAEAACRGVSKEGEAIAVK